MPNSVGPTSCSRRSACRQTPAPSIVWIHSILRGDSPFLSGNFRLEVQRRGPRGASKLKGHVLTGAQAGLHAGLSNCKVAAQVGVSEQTIRKGLKEGRLVRPPAGRDRARRAPTGPPASTPGQRSTEDAGCGGGVAVKREAEPRAGADRPGGGGAAPVHGGRVGGQSGGAGGAAGPAGTGSA